MCSKTRISVLLFLSLCGIVQAQFVLNPSFEDKKDFNSWTLLGGDENIWTSANGYAAPLGSNYAEMSSNELSSPPAQLASSLEGFLGLASGTLLAQGSGPNTTGVGEGSAIKQSSISITANNGGLNQFLTFKWNLITANDPSGFNTTERDYGFLTVSKSGGGTTFIKLADIQSPLMHRDDANAVFKSETGWQTSSSFQFTSTGTYTIGFGILDINGQAGDNVSSALLIDNVALSSVPEPSVWAGLTGIGLAAFAGARAWRRLGPRQP